MSEYFLHYLWQYQYFDSANLQTSERAAVTIFHPGYRNTHAGPDFFQSKIRIGEMQWVGSVEIHVLASEWYRHNHDNDPAYENVVLHVVWSADKPVVRKDGSVIPVIELKGRVSEDLLLQAKSLVNSPEQIPCAKSMRNVRSITRISALDTAMVQRLEAKSDMVLALYERNHCDWTETFYQLLFKNFGFKVNTEPFMQLARAIPYRLLLKHLDKPIQIEAFLFGVAGFLEDDAADDHQALLSREFTLLRRKYALSGRELEKSQWKFLRLRPGNFPTLRLAQLSAVLRHEHLFSKLLSETSLPAIRKMLLNDPSPYWKTHYRFGKESKLKDSLPGESSVDNIILNSIVPALAACSKLKDDQTYLDRAVTFLQEISPEVNAITKLWSELGMKPKTAFDSQAQIELYSSFCMRKRCLECAIGHDLLKQRSR